MTLNFKILINKYIDLLKIKMKTEECIQYKLNNYDEYFNIMRNYVPEFYNQYPTLFKLIIKDELDDSILNLFLDKINSIHIGDETLENVRNDLGHFLHNKYVKNEIS